jgi:hypothetical protein
MGKRRTSLAAVVVVIVLGATGAQGQGVAPKSVRLEFPETVNLTGLAIRYFLVGPFGGFGSFVRTQSDVRVYDVEASHAGQTARTLKAIVYCPGRRIVLISESGFGNGSAKTLPVNFETLGSVPLAGRVLVADSRPLQVEVTYLAPWGHSFFGISDGAITSFRVASTQLRPDGSFSVLVPDLVSDPVVAGYGPDLRGWFQLVAREPETGNIAFFLRSGDEASRPMGVPIAREYPGELQFDIAK